MNTHGRNNNIASEPKERMWKKLCKEEEGSYKKYDMICELSNNNTFFPYDISQEWNGNSK